MKIRTTAPPKPGIVATMDLIKTTGLPLVSGALMDQPHIWLVQMEMADGVRRLFELYQEVASS